MSAARLLDAARRFASLLENEDQLDDQIGSLLAARSKLAGAGPRRGSATDRAPGRLGPADRDLPIGVVRIDDVAAHLLAHFARVPSES